VAKKDDGSTFVTLAALGLGAWLLNKIVTDPRISPFWRKIAETEEGDIYQHIISAAVVTVLA
jgi:hypothetical protein